MPQAAAEIRHCPPVRTSSRWSMKRTPPTRTSSFAAATLPRTSTFKMFQGLSRSWMPASAFAA